MRKKLIAFISTLSLCFCLPTMPAKAIENGTDDLNNALVVQIQLNFSNYTTSCSGALLAPKIVVTADHCIKLVGESNKNNVIQSAKVAPAGTARDGNLTSYVNVTDFFLTPREGKNGAAFLVLQSALDFKFPVRIASAADIDDLQTKKLPIKFAGYGITDKNQIVYKAFPQIADGELFSNLENSHIHFRSNPAAPCGGDSGGPVYQQLDSEVLLIGVIQGPWYTRANMYCSTETLIPGGVQQNKAYAYSVYIPLYTSDAVSDLKLATDKVSSARVLSNPNKDELDYKSVQLKHQKLLSRFDFLKRRYVNNYIVLAMEKKARYLPFSPLGDYSKFIAEIESFNKKIDSSLRIWDRRFITKIECVLGDKTKIVTSKSPKCPKGYKIK
ncbi:unannotated protein [freshwater metagenome]|uniref:Unannotated protein n=1 Tax=freshwater metagenome TaxID=449393 RepID=A0A6J6KYX1_9ZZZZ|nr:trypsin-like serine protease [Actinomycetota bacterium]